MTYTYVRAVGVPITGHSGEKPVDVTDIPTQKYFTLFSKLIIVVNDGLLNKNLALNAFDYQYEFQLFTGTIIDWLATKTNDALTLSSTLPGEELVYVKTGDVLHNGFRVVPANHLLSEDRQALLTPSNATDLKLYSLSKNTDYTFISKNGLFVMNGHFIRGMKRDDGIYLIGGGNNFRIYKDSQVNLLDFNRVSTLNTYPFTEDMIRFIEEDGFTGLEVVLNQNITNKKVWLIVGGRLVTGSPLVTRTGENALRIDYRHYKWPERIFESLSYIDLSNLYDKDRKVILSKKLYTSDTFKRLLLNDNSFFVVFDNPDFGITVTPLVNYRYPTVFLVHEKYHHPLMLDNGLFPGYLSEDCGNEMLWSIDIRVKPNYVNRLAGVNNGGDLYHAFSNRYFNSTLVKGYTFKIHTLV